MPKPERLIHRRRQFTPPQLDGEFLFPEEFVELARGGAIKPNVPPEIRSNARTLRNTLGHPFRHAPRGTNGPEWKAYHFDRYAHLLMDAVRNYNRALYRLRRAHFYFDHNHHFGAMDPLPQDEVVFPGSNAEAAFLVVEDQFVAASTLLRTLVSLPLLDFPDPITGMNLCMVGNVDCIRTNDYIVSVRIGGEATDRPAREFGIREPPYSSSSFTSISSAFSSYSSFDGWHAGP